MNNTMEYKGYVGSVEFSEEDGLFFGSIQGIRSLISYDGTDAKSLVQCFHEAVDDYLEDCKKYNWKPEVPYKGSLNIRIGRDLHSRAAIYCLNHERTLNSFIEEAIREKLESVAL